MAKNKNILTKKIIIVGDKNVGKTSILKNIPSNRHCTVEQVSANKFEVKLYMKRKMIQFVIWDGIISGYKTDYRHIAYKNTDLILVCYSVDSKSSLENVEKNWIPEIQTYCPNIPHILVANKTDVRDVITKSNYDNTGDFNDSDEYINWKQGEHLAEKLESLAFTECSAAKREGLETLVGKAVEAFLGPKKEKHKECTIL